MKKLPLTIFMIVVFSSIFFCSYSNANPVGIIAPTPRIALTSPNQDLYSQNIVTLSFSCQPVTWVTIEYSGIKYWIDGKLHGQIDRLEASEVFSTQIGGLADGIHNVEVTCTANLLNRVYPYVEVPWGPAMFITTGKISLTVDTASPQITFLPVNISENRALVNFTANEPVVWIAYSLNGQNRVTITDNALRTRPYGQDNYQFALDNLSEGANRLEVYAKDAAENEASSSVEFFIADVSQPSSSPSSSPAPTSSLTETSTPTPAIKTSSTAPPATTSSSAQTPQPTASPTIPALVKLTPSSIGNSSGWQMDPVWLVALASAVLGIFAIGAATMLKRRR